MRVGIDISGGDFAPLANIRGAILAKKTLQESVTIVLIGNQEDIAIALESENTDQLQFEIVHAPDVITMHDHPARAFTQKPKSSISVGFEMLAKGKLNAFASTGNTGAMLVGSIYKIKDLKNRVNEMIQMVGLELEQHKKIGALSKGYKQRVGLAQAFIHDPQVLILDEPTSGLDPNQLVEIRELIKTIGKEKTIMLSTHIMQEVEAICDRVIIINKGKIVANNNQQALDTSPEVQTIYIEFEGAVSSQLLSKIPGVTTVKALGNGWLIEGVTDQDLRKNVSKKAQKAGWLIMTLKLEKKSLEAVFKELTKN